MEDTRCCGSGTCIINAKGYCWCGQRWDGTRMCYPAPADSQRSDEGSKLQLPTGDGTAQA